MAKGLGIPVLKDIVKQKDTYYHIRMLLTDKEGKRRDMGNTEHGKGLAQTNDNNKP